MRLTRPVFDPLQWQAALLDTQAATHAPPIGIAQRQQQRLKHLLAAACAAPLYRERLAGLGDAPALQRIAPVTRDELMSRFDDAVTDADLHLDALQDFVADPARAGEPWLGRYMVWESSGTCGAPGVFVQDARAMAVYDALEAVRQRPPARATWPWAAFTPLAPLQWLGAGDRHALVTATGGHFASAVSFERLRAITLGWAPTRAVSA